jgi:chromatin remodeling complex protein RSC6
MEANQVNSEDAVNNLDSLDKNQTTINEQFENILNILNNFKTQITAMHQQIKLVEKNVRKEFKVLKKEVEKNKIKGNKKPSGFATPSKVTNELCDFMDKEKGSEIARTVVTKSLIDYIKKNNLENNENNQIIHPDEKLQNLLGIDENEKLTYFTLQKHMNKHFIKKAKQTAEI